jgi:hypothetical protein
MRLRELVRSQAVRSAMERSCDAVLAFALQRHANLVRSAPGEPRRVVGDDEPGQRRITGRGGEGIHMRADELRAISRKLSTYVELHPDDKDARAIAHRCGEIAALLEASSAYQRLRARDPGSGGLEDRLLRVASGAPLTRREIRLAGIFALVWFAMDGFWFISTLNHWFGL